MIKPLHDLLRSEEQLPKTEHLERLCEGIWWYSLEKNWSLSLKKEVKTYHVKGDWNKDGFGYVLYARSSDQGLLVGLNTKFSTEDTISYLGELRAIYWAHQDTKRLTQGRHITL